MWSSSTSLDTLNAHCKDNILAWLGIEFIEIGENYLVARMPVDHRTQQPFGILHGGASCVLAETIGSMGAEFCIDRQKYYCVGLDINTNHIRTIRSGFVIGTGKPFHVGRSTQVWGIEIVDEQHKLVSVTRLTMAVLQKPL